MPCIFCTAVFMALAGQVTVEVIDQIQQRLQKKAKNGVQKTVDTDSVAKFECTVEAAGKDIPVAVTVMKAEKRVRIQLLSHELDQEQANKLQDNLADVLDLRIVERSDPASEARVREAFEHEPSPVAADREPGRLSSRLPWSRGQSR